MAAINSKFELTVVGECKWSENKMGISIFRELEEKVIKHNLPMAEDCQFILFSKSEFTSDLEQLAAERKNIVLTSELGR